jgi:hypothetical protein
MFGHQTTHEARRLDLDDDEVEDADNECVLCSGSLVVLGTLGNRLHFRCRNCGIEQSRKVTS